jgi:hypothetical protein
LKDSRKYSDQAGPGQQWPGLFFVQEWSMNHEEHQGEKAIIEALRGVGLKAHHMDTNVDGFPDIIVMGRRIVMIEMKKHFKRSTLLRNIMEPSQPVFMHDAQIHGYMNIYLCVCKPSKLYDLYNTSGILLQSIGDKPLSALNETMHSADAMDIASFCLFKCNEEE